ncbi:hypothetical protein A0H81_12124 [Grifola frondosa]|uniref:Yeast cell wall synthesis Kre9/Knh1-like N-terminal domain-containing protein n=1 Tax=Grifola frondosa TaxID=5627 RepID=A0A1C7LU08_GRIFR|nr:hypothetical protein A0H81_12124 [Grifola frondosa]
MRSVAALLIFAASSLAYSITGPNNITGWTTSGPNSITWTRVSTDPSNFTIVLDSHQGDPTSQQVLATGVDGSEGSMTVSPPSGGWVAGTGNRVNFVKDGGILAQSSPFNITAN